ncbi:MAG: DUF2971 domain-containing protein [Terriglobales bacterium]|jgi:hypothetical protein
MTAVDVSKQLTGNTKLWRYLSLDKLIDLLSTGELFFAPLSFFVKTDPFEGYLPAAAMSALAEITRQPVMDLESFIPVLEDHCKRTGRELASGEREILQHRVEDLKTTLKSFFLPIAHCQTVNCWHANDSESEAMWRLYADNGKAVAIETTLDALRESIQSQESEHRVHIYPVKYLDFFDKGLKPRDCVVEGHLTPLLKRLSYHHENEVRAFIGRVPKDLQESRNIKYWQPAPVRLPVDVKTLVRRVHVSPYPSEPFESSVIKICELLGLDVGVVEPSKMLSGQEELLKQLDY